LLLSRPRGGGDAVEAGKLSLRCLAAPEECESEDDVILALFLPHNMICADSYKVEIRQEMKAFLADYLLLLYQSIPRLQPQDVPHIAAATTSLLAACLSPSEDRLVEARGPIGAALLRRASTIIMERLADQQLTPDQLCRELGVSRSGLYRIFEPVGGISNFIRRKRLQKTRDMLANGLDQRAISSIAEEWGFTDPSTYSRMFRKEFGISPREAREEGWQGHRRQIWLPVDPSADKPLTLNSVLLGSY
jgi:AraC-like DNA-binding protein